MLTAKTRFETENASRYLQQLCKHFAHKVSVEFDETTGRAELPPGPATLTADTGGLDIAVTGPDADGLKRAKYIVEDHLLRFAFREEPKALDWTI
ncbi:DUF2218 domain-containing protein [Pseudooceanicola sp. LIPI14-2-Ac024]|uniref:DUF2218 domain-containing protein n=1 Tax=Pseudooceanicola sp. LIPI14-2-Ac024 TaxID=3344875 RepID=UPI0035CFEF83